MKVPNPLTALRAAVRAVKAALSGEEILAPDKVVTDRTATCEGCPFFDPDFRQCNSCGCMVDLKVQLATEECPEGRWGRVRLTGQGFRQLITSICRKIQRLAKKVAQWVRSANPTSGLD